MYKEKIKSAVSAVSNSKPGLIACGILIGILGERILRSKALRKAVTYTAAGVMRVREGVLTAVTGLREKTDDIIADAKDINGENL